MMVICGKCGFYQPHDRYCANCGIDMLAYRPARKPLFKRLISNTAFQGFLVVATIAVGFGVASFKGDELSNENEIASSAMVKTKSVENKRSDLSSKSDHGKPSGHEGTTVSASSAPAPHGDSPAGHPVAGTNPPGEKSVGLSADTPPAAPGTAPVANSASPPATAAPGAAAPEMKVIFGEMHRQLVDQMLSEDRNASSYGAVKAGVVNGIGAKLKAARDAIAWHQIEATDFQTMRSGQSIHIFRGHEFSGQQFGVVISALPGQADEASTPLRLEIVTKMLEASGGAAVEEVKAPIPGALVLPRGGAILVSGTLPRRALQDVERQFYGNAEVFRIYRSENFRAGFSDFVILFESK